MFERRSTSITFDITTYPSRTFEYLISSYAAYFTSQSRFNRFGRKKNKDGDEPSIFPGKLDPCPCVCPCCFFFSSQPPPRRLYYAPSIFSLPFSRASVTLDVGARYNDLSLARRTRQCQRIEVSSEDAIGARISVQNTIPRSTVALIVAVTRR